MGQPLGDARLLPQLRLQLFCRRSSMGENRCRQMDFQLQSLCFSGDATDTINKSDFVRQFFLVASTLSGAGLPTASNE